MQAHYDAEIARERSADELAAIERIARGSATIPSPHATRRQSVTAGPRPTVSVRVERIEIR
jgi:hypothetical protein